MIAAQMTRNRKGFSLIEMLVVISVIGILVTLAGHHNTRVLKKAKDASLKLEVSQLRIALHQYALDNFGKFPESLQELSPDYLKSVSPQWKGAQGTGNYFYNQSDGNILLYDISGQELSAEIDAGDNQYGSY